PCIEDCLVDERDAEAAPAEDGEPHVIHCPHASAGWQDRVTMTDAPAAREPAAPAPDMTARARLDLLVTGPVFFDLVFTGLPHGPVPGTEIWAGGMGAAPGGIANLAVGAARLGLDTGLAAAFGDDAYADW